MFPVHIFGETRCNVETGRAHKPTEPFLVVGRDDAIIGMAFLLKKIKNKKTKQAHNNLINHMSRKLR